MRTDWVGRGGVRVGVVVVLLAGMASAQAARDLAGTWQGALPIGKGQRLLLKITRQGAKRSRVAYDLDSVTPSEGRNTTQMSLAGSEVRLAIAPIDASYEGKLSEDGASITGTWTQGGQPRALNLARATDDTQWEVPKPTAAMAKDADPDWEVVTVRPTDPSATNASIRMNGREFLRENRSVETLPLAGYGVHKKQIVNAPDWIRTERWDVRGVPDLPGQPSLRQMQALVRKVLTERFGLVTHTEKREMEEYALTATMRAANMSMGDFMLTMKFFMDRPVVDQTGLTGRYDFQLNWAFDESRVPTDGTAPPGLFTAIQEQLGLKLEPVKAQTDVLVVDAVEHPSAN